VCQKHREGPQNGQEEQHRRQYGGAVADFFVTRKGGLTKQPGELRGARCLLGCACLAGVSDPQSTNHALFLRTQESFPSRHNFETHAGSAKSAGMQGR
jgi:hypothetical protein